MEARDEVTVPAAPRSLDAIDPGKLWVLGLTIEPDGKIAGPALRRYSFWAECECPGDCNRDHENE
jgi:hypothetical protein